MQTKDLVFDECSQREVVEHVSEQLPDAGVPILPQAFVIEAIHLSDRARLVVSSEDSDSVPPTDFENHHQIHGFDAVVASVNVIS